MNETHLPPLPSPNATGSDVCAVIRLYLAVWADLTEEQRQHISEHLRHCTACKAEQHLLEQVSRIVAGLEPSAPAARVDQAVMTAIAARGRSRLATAMPASGGSGKTPPRRSPWRLMSLVAVAVAVLFAAFATLHFARAPSTAQRAFLIPTGLTWAGYVLYQVQDGLDKKGNSYRIVTYYNLGNKDMNVETVMDGSLDVVMVSDTRKALGLDMLHHVAQWNAHAWGSDESMFDLNELKNELARDQSAYLGTGNFAGERVYRVRCTDGFIMLLDRHYMPVNVLRSNGTPLYETLEMLLPSQVPASMWDMSVPPGFRMGTLPAKP
jgi:hypothetical protein